MGIITNGYLVPGAVTAPSKQPWDNCPIYTILLPRPWKNSYGSANLHVYWSIPLGMLQGTRIPARTALANCIATEHALLPGTIRWSCDIAVRMAP